jgi:hypothetical protein
MYLLGPMPAVTIAELPAATGSRFSKAELGIVILREEWLDGVAAARSVNTVAKAEEAPSAVADIARRNAHLRVVPP